MNVMNPVCFQAKRRYKIVCVLRQTKKKTSSNPRARTENTFESKRHHEIYAPPLPPWVSPMTCYICRASSKAVNRRIAWIRSIGSNRIRLSADHRHVLTQFRVHWIVVRVSSRLHCGYRIRHSSAGWRCHWVYSLSCRWRWWDRHSA